MRALEIYRNGKKLCLAGIGYGDLGCHISLLENKRGKSAWLNVNGRPLANRFESHRWENRRVRLNDEFRVRIVGVETVDRPKIEIDNEREIRKRTLEWVRDNAKHYGWTVLTRPVMKRPRSRAKA